MSPPNPNGGVELPSPPAVAPPPVAYAQPVYIGQPGPQLYVGVVAHNVPNDTGVWTTGLFDCFDDATNCLITCFFPCVTFGQNAEIIDRGRHLMGSQRRANGSANRSHGPSVYSRWHVFAFAHPFARANSSHKMCPKNLGGGSKAPPPPMATSPPMTFSPEPSAPPAYIGYPIPPQVYVGTPIHNVPGVEVGLWTTGLCDCFDDLSNCLTTFFCPCITFGQNAEIIDRGSTSCACAGALCFLIFNLSYCSFWYTCTYRTKLRGLFSIPGDQCGDCCVHFWCNPCALCQEYRELKNRGFDPSIGWAANEERITRQVGIAVPPPVPNGMLR